MLDTRIYKKILECNLTLSALYDSINSLFENQEQEDVDKVVQFIEKLDIDVEALKNSIKTGVEFMTDEENITEIDATPTENGLKI